MLKVAIATPTRDRPHPAYLSALERSVPLLDQKYEHATVFEVGCPYISGARATCLRKAMKWGADVFVFIDDDVSWQPEDLIALIEAPGDVVGGTYRFKVDGDPKYMGRCCLGSNNLPLVREGDEAIQAICLPAGFLKVTRAGIERFMAAFPELTINADGEGDSPDLFNHGAHKGVWFGEDYAFCRRWGELGGDIWLLPKLQLDHNGADGRVWPGNFHQQLLADGAKA